MPSGFGAAVEVSLNFNNHISNLSEIPFQQAAIRRPLARHG
jgi:hypothetical protein